MKKQDIEKEDIEHIREAKRRIVFTMVWFGLAFLVSYFYSNDLLEFITAKGKSAGYEFVYISPAEVLMAQLKITALAALVITFPIIIINVAAYIGPALEKGAISIILPSIFAIFMFGLGITFSYLVLMPFVFNTLLDIGVTTDITAQVSVENYISLYLTLLVSLGIVFELPIISLILTLTDRFLIKLQKIAPLGERDAICD